MEQSNDEIKTVHKLYHLIIRIRRNKDNLQKCKSVI